MDIRTADHTYHSPKNPVSAISHLAPFVVHLYPSHSNLHGRRSNGACTLSREEITATAINASPVSSFYSFYRVSV